jgi:O-acetyl-ADP-ribose deacetylase (regulator of RNase III)
MYGWDCHPLLRHELERGLSVHDEPQLLASAYRESLRLADEHGCTSIAFPAISTGIYGYPLDEATAIAVATVRDARGLRSLRDVTFACFSHDTLAAYQKAMA